MTDGSYAPGSVINVTVQSTTGVFYTDKGPKPNPPEVPHKSRHVSGNDYTVKIDAMFTACPGPVRIYQVNGDGSKTKLKCYEITPC